MLYRMFFVTRARMIAYWGKYFYHEYIAPMPWYIRVLSTLVDRIGYIHWESNMRIVHCLSTMIIFTKHNAHTHYVTIVIGDVLVYAH